MFSLEDIKVIVARKNAPRHPGKIALDALGDVDVNYDELYVMYGINRLYSQSFFMGESPITIEIANELDTVLDNGSEYWIRLQEVYDLWHFFNNKSEQVDGLTRANTKWAPLTDDELDEQIEAARSVTNKEPRSLSLVRFADDSSFRKAVTTGTISGVLMSDYNALLYLGPIPNQHGHGAYVNLDTNVISVVDIDELVELSEDEV